MPTDNCAKHPDHVVGWDDSLDDLAKAIGNMRYDKVHQFISHLSAEIFRQYRSDRKAGKVKLAERLQKTSRCLDESVIEMMTAWEICKSFMKDNNEPK